METVFLLPPAPENGSTTKDAHEGTDCLAPVGQSGVAARNGIVDYAGLSGKLGNVVIVKNLDGSRSQYIHVTPAVKEGDVVKVGTSIAKVGKVGEDGGTLTTGPHLHYGENDATGKVVSTIRVMSLSSIRNMNDW